MIKKVKSVKKIPLQPLFDITVAEDSSYTTADGLINSNTGTYYSANTIIIMGRSQEKTGSEVTGYKFTMNIEKSRFVKEKAKLELYIHNEKGLNKYSGLLELAVASGFVDNSSKGYYAKVNQETGEIGTKVRMKDTNNEEFWSDILSNPKFDSFIRHKFQLGNGVNETDFIEEEMSIDE